MIVMIGKDFEYMEEHVGDIAFIAYGDTLEEAFSNAAKALINIMVNIEKVEPKEVKEVEIRSEDLLGLLKNWLEELLFIFDSEGLVFSVFNVKIEKKNGEYILKAKIYGEPFDPEKHEPDTEVKAVSYHMMKIGEIDGKKFVRVLVDI